MQAPVALTPDIAEVFGVLIGDGCVCRYVSRGRTNFQVAFTAGANEYWYYESFIKPALESAFSVKGYLYLRRDNTTRYHIYSIQFASYLAAMGIPIGKKVDASIPQPILDQGLAVPFIRGVYHAEGSLYRRYTKAYNRQTRVYSNLLVIQIRMKLMTLMNQVRTELLNLGISPNRLTEKDGVYTLRITAQEEIARFLEIVKPRYKSNLSPARF